MAHPELVRLLEQSEELKVAQLSYPYVYGDKLAPLPTHTAQDPLV
jgi:hypothetical protein